MKAKNVWFFLFTENASNACNFQNVQNCERASENYYYNLKRNKYVNKRKNTTVRIKKNEKPPCANILKWKI